MVDAIQLIKCEKIEVNDKNSFNFRMLKVQIRFLQLMLCLLAALFGGIQRSFTKGFITCIDMDGGTKLSATWVYGATALILAAFQLLAINKGLQLFPQVAIIPIYETTLIMMNLFCGAIILNERENWEFLEGLILSGCALFVSLGVYLIVKKPQFLCFKEKG